MYKLLKNLQTGEVNVVLLIETNTAIPFNPENTDYQAYIAWLKVGNVPLSADEDNITFN